MPVELPDMLSVLAHELRSPLSVLQGYIRLLQRKRDAADPEAAMLTAMLAATSRLTTLGRQASDLAGWLRRDDPASSADAAALADAVAAQVPAGVTVLPVPDAAARLTIPTPDLQALAQALAALVDLSLRETRQTTAVIGVRAIGANALGVTIGAGPDAATLVGSDAPPAAEPVPYNRGGLGLGLSLASYVLASHDAEATASPDLGRIDVRIPTGGHPR